MTDHREGKARRIAAELDNDRTAWSAQGESIVIAREAGASTEVLDALRSRHYHRGRLLADFCRAVVRNNPKKSIGYERARTILRNDDPDGAGRKWQEAQARRQIEVDRQQSRPAGLLADHESAHAEGLHDELSREGCSECATRQGARVR